jgi:hypothetical protein
MATAELRVTYEPDDDWTGELIATVRSGAFSAQGSAWVGRDVYVFLTALRTYPLPSEKPPRIEGRIWDGRLRISVEPYNSRGMLLVRVDLASEIPGARDADLRNSATICFLTEYAVVDRFAAELQEVMDSRREVAILKGTVD